MKKQHAIRAALVIAALIVWGNNLVQIVSGLKSESEPEWISERSAMKRGTGRSLAVGDSVPVFKGQFNDPFLPDVLEPGPPDASGSSSKSSKRVSIAQGPPFRFIGYMGDASSPLGVVEFEEGSRIVHKGDTLLGLTVVKVLPESLAFRKGRTVKWVRLNQ
jgi:hypothetical protein